MMTPEDILRRAAALCDDDGYPRFTDAEMQRRRQALLEGAAEHDVAQVLLVGIDRSGSAVQWITGWPASREAYVVVDANEPDAMFVQFFNHLPQAKQLAHQARVSWRGPSAVPTIVEELRRRGAPSNRLGVIGPMSAGLHKGLTAAGFEVVPLGALYTELRSLKSAEEIEWLRIGAALSDAGINAMCSGLRAGMTEWDLADLVERAYVPLGGTTHIHYFGVTPMAAPARANPGQYLSYRQVQPGDAVTLELSASFWGYTGQVLRTFAVEQEPSRLYRELHDAAELAFARILDVLADGTTPEEVMDAASVIEDAGFTTLDDLVHGYGGGYFPPVLGSRSRNHDPGGAAVVRAGMTLVVQPNVVTPDGRAGVQTGELVFVSADGVERLHSAPAGLIQVG